MNATPASLRDLLEPFKPQAVAKACGVTTDSVYAWKRRERVPRDASVIRALSDLLKVDAAELLAIIDADSAKLKAA